MKRTPTLHPSQAQLVPGYRLDGRYELLFPYAQGGMATVWVARLQGKHGFEKLVAIKTILPHVARDPSFRTMFLDEARIASRIRHPNVANLDDLGEDESTLYMVLEWIDGDSWAKLIHAIGQSGHALPINVMLRIAADACAGLHAAHELRDDRGNLLQVVHRDVSPQNILVSNTGVTKVIDFGIAKARDRTSEETRTGLLKGKLEYAAPEQATMKPVDRRADVWAMGTILYQIVAGHLPYQEKSDLATLRALASGKPPIPLPAHVPDAIRAVILRALAPLEHRFATAAEMQQAIEAAITQPTTANDVALCLRTYLASRMESRRKDIAEALAEAAERAAAEAEAGAPEAAARAPSIPDEPVAPARASRLSLPSIDATSRRKPEVDELTTMMRDERGPVRPVHLALMALATAVTVAVWVFAGSILLSPSPGATTSPGAASTGTVK